MTSTLNNIFDKTYVINLRSRKDRLEQCNLEFIKHNIDYNVFSAKQYKGDIPAGKIKLPGNVGCVLSHVEIIKEASLLGLNNILIFEDDVVFCEDFNNKFNSIINELPADWDMFYLGGNTIEPDKNLKKVTSNIFKTTGTKTTHAYAIKNTIFKKVIKGQLEFNYPVDGFYRNIIQPAHNCYIVNPNMAWQRPGFSDIQCGFRDYNLGKSM